MKRRRFHGYYVIREYGHRMPTQYGPLFVPSFRKAQWLAEWYDRAMRDRYCTAFYAYVIRADELAAVQAEAYDHARYPDDPRHWPLTVERAPRERRL